MRPPAGPVDHVSCLRQLTTHLRVLAALSRPPVFVLLAVYAALGLAGAGHASDHLLLARALLPVAAFLMFSAAVNDLADERIDRVNLPGDPSRPLVNASALRGEMTLVALVCAAVALAGGFLLGPGSGLVVTAGLCVSAGYSLQPIRLSDRGAVAALVLPACYVAVPYLLGRLAAAPLPQERGLLLPLGLYVGFIGRILLKDFRDVRGDALFGKRTFWSATAGYGPAGSARSAGPRAAPYSSRVCPRRRRPWWQCRPASSRQSSGCSTASLQRLTRAVRHC